MAFYIKSPRKDWGYADHYDIREYLGVQGKLPKDFCKVVMVPLKDGRTTELRCLPGREARLNQWGRLIKSSKHRCFAECPDCGASVPAGRTHQHKCKEG
jgi:hypothetical protein